MSAPEKCKEHPKYKAIFAPRATTKNTQGCPACWEIYERKQYGSAERDDVVGLGVAPETRIAQDTGWLHPISIADK